MNELLSLDSPFDAFGLEKVECVTLRAVVY